MECNFAKNGLRIVRGNAFTLRIVVKAYRTDGSEVSGFILDPTTDVLLMTTSTGVRAIPFTVEDGSTNHAIVSFGGGLQVGYYGLDFSGIFNGEDWRFAAKNVFSIVELTAQGNVPKDGIVTEDTYDVVAGVSLSLLGPQADWAENDPTKQSYVKNKPVIYTKSEIDVLLAAEVQARQQADGVLDVKIADEVTRAKAAEKVNADDIDAIEEKIPSGASSSNKLVDNQTMTNGLAQKQDTINDLQTIREGAAAGALAAPQATTYTKTEVDGLIGNEETRAKAAEKANADDIDAIEAKIPAAASSSNQLADKQFVNSSIATNTATYRGSYNLVSDLSLTVAATQQQIAAALATKMTELSITPENNDYCFVQIPTADATPTEISRIDRYKYNGTAWLYEYSLNNSSFTAAQWAAINSGITSGLVTKLGDLPTSTELAAALLAKQDVISDLQTIREGAAAGALAAPQATTYTKTEVDNLLGQKQDTLTFDNAPTEGSDDPVKSGGVYAADANLQSQITALQNIVADLETIAEGYVRVAGSSSPALSHKSYKYHEQGGFGRESVFHLFYPCLVGTPLTGSGTEGKILHILQKLGYEDGNGKAVDIYGNVRAIDGSEGDVMICNIEPYFRIMGKHTIEGTEYDVFLVSRTPFTWQGIDAEEVMKGGHAPDFCVSHTDTDSVTRMHSVYNPAWNGSYTAPAGVVGKYVQSVDAETGDIVETYDENETLLGGSGGLHTTDLALYDGEQRAMNNNPDTTKCVPWMNVTAASVEDMFALMLAEGGTFDAHNATLMGSGFSSNDPATAAADWEESGSGAKNGLRVQDKNGTWKYYALSGNVRFLFGESSGTRYAANCINSWRNPFHIMEAHRAVSYAIQNGVHELEFFVFEGNKYKYRSVNGFNGPAQGEMTCVVWKMFATKAGFAAVDPTDGATSIAGNRVEILVSVALFHGVTTQVSPSWWTSGLIFTEDASQNYEAYMERDQESLIKSENGEIATSSNFNFETLYKHVGSFTTGDGYAKNYSNDALMLPDTNANKSGGGLHTYVGKYNWFSGAAAGSGKKLVRGFRRGSAASSSPLSPLSMGANAAPSYANPLIGFGTCCRITE